VLLGLLATGDALHVGGKGPTASAWSALFSDASRKVAACALAATLVVSPLHPSAFADGSSVGGQSAGVDVARPAVLGSPVAEEVWALLDKYFLDRSFNGVNFKAEHVRLQQLAPLTEAAALDESESLVRRLGDRYSRVLAPQKAGKLGKYDVTGVGLNLIISDAGEFVAPSPRSRHPVSPLTARPRRPGASQARCSWGLCQTGAPRRSGRVLCTATRCASATHTWLRALPRPLPPHPGVSCVSCRRRRRRIRVLAPPTRLAAHTPPRAEGSPKPPNLAPAQVLEINGKPTKGMNSFDALEAIQSDPAAAEVMVKSVVGGGERTVCGLGLLRRRGSVAPLTPAPCRPRSR